MRPKFMYNFCSWYVFFLRLVGFKLDVNLISTRGELELETNSFIGC